MRVNTKEAVLNILAPSREAGCEGQFQYLYNLFDIKGSPDH